jgi:hypothetical protein
VKRSGATRPDTLVLTASNELPNALSIFNQGNLQLAGGVPLGDGLRCVGGALERLFVRNAVQGVASAPAPGAFRSPRSAELGDVIAPGATRY